MSRVAITGANSYSGQYVSKMLRQKGHDILNISSSQRTHSLGQLDTVPYSFQDRKRFTADLKGVDTLVNTYWVRFNDYQGMTRE